MSYGKRALVCLGGLASLVAFPFVMEFGPRWFQLVVLAAILVFGYIAASHLDRVRNKYR